MPRKIIISFIGTGEYKPCIYRSEELQKQSSVVTFVQTAIASVFTEDWSDNDRIFVFETDGAKSKHRDKLEEELRSIDRFKMTEFVTIPDGLTESDLWQIFTKVGNKVNQDDIVTLDLTHGFRSLPMLALVLLNFLKTTKKIQVERIIYGAFESLGSAYNIDERIPNPKDRVAPLVDYTNFSLVQEWSYAARNFQKYGVYADIAELTKDEIRNRLKISQGTDEVAQNLRLFGSYLEALFNTIQFNRAKALNEYNWDRLNELMQSISTTDTGIQPINDLMYIIEQKLAQLNQPDLPIWLKSSKWCLEHELIQEGLTQLQEGLLTHFVEIHEEKLKSFDKEKDKRTFLTSILIVAHREIKKAKWQPNLKANENLSENLLDYFQETNWPKIFSDLTSCRNDINHSGMVENPIKPENLISNLKKSIESVERNLNFSKPILQL